MKRLLLAVLAVALVGPAVTADDASLPPLTYRVDRAYIGAMKDPVGTFAVYFQGEKTNNECPLNPAWTVRLHLRPRLDGTYIRSVCPRTGPTPCECDIYFRSSYTMKDWELALAMFRSPVRHSLSVDLRPAP